MRLFLVFVVLIVPSLFTTFFIFILMREKMPIFHDGVTSENPSFHTSVDISKLTQTLNAKFIHNTKKKITRDNRLGSLYGGPAHSQLYQPDRILSESEYRCISLQFQPTAYVCIHPLNIDQQISFTLERDGLWEGHSLEAFRQILLSDEDLGVFDIGANIGIYTMVAASMGHKVVAVEPHIPNLRQLYKSLQMNKCEKNVIVLENALSNNRGAYELFIPDDNQGGINLTPQDADKFCKYPEVCPPWTSTIILNDLLEVTNFDRAIIKIDVEGHEHKALRLGKRLFQYIQITHILMEWQVLRRYYGTQLDESDNKALVNEMIYTLQKRGFIAKDIFMRNILSLQHWYSWPDNVIWVHVSHSRTNK